MREVVVAIGLVVAVLAAAGVGIGLYSGGTSVEQVPAAQPQEASDGYTQSLVLSDEEARSILFMREEEKLARDVYLTLYEMYGLQVFKNIAESEQRHMDAVLTLIEKYNLTDPAQPEVGVFTNETLQELYNTLIERASKSVVDAIMVGALIEEKDIIDINKLINESSNPDVIRVFSNLVNGSANHLRAFASQYERLTGEPYTPQLLSADKYEAVLESAAARP